MAQPSRQPNELLIRNPSLLGPAIWTVASYPDGAQGKFSGHLQATLACELRVSRQRGLVRLEDFSRTKILAGVGDGHRELLLCEAILQIHRRAEMDPSKNSSIDVRCLANCLVTQIGFVTAILADWMQEAAGFQNRLARCQHSFRSDFLTGMAAALATVCILGETASGDPLLGRFR
jgi:hypothetical protein